MLIAAIFFGLTFLKIRKLAAWDKQDTNWVELRRVAWITSACFIGQCCIFICFVLQLVVQGSFGTVAVIIAILAGNVLTIMQVVFIIVTVLVDLDLTLHV